MEAVMFIPFTEGSKLKKELMEMEDNMPYLRKVKFVEAMVPTIGDQVIMKDPASGKCGRETCLLCESQPGKCMRQGLVYSITCNTCKEKGKEVAI